MIRKPFDLKSDIMGLFSSNYYNKDTQWLIAVGKFQDKLVLYRVLL